MNCNVKVSGIPKNIQLDTLIRLFSTILSMRTSDFLVRILSSKGEVKDVLLTLSSQPESRIARDKLDNYVYEYNNITYVFTATIPGYKKYPRKANKFQNQNRHSYKHQYGFQSVGLHHQDKSCSPNFKDTSSELDLQIEILRKQRMVLEEERKLLEEQRKLEEFKMKTFNNEGPSATTTCVETVEKHVPSLNPSKKKPGSKQHYLNIASGVLLKKMNVLVQEYSSLEERQALCGQLRSIIKQRLAMVVATSGQDDYETQQIITLYRSRYPPSEDKELVKEVLKDVKGHSTNEIKSVHVTGAGAGDRMLQEGKGTAEDTTLSGNSNVTKTTEAKANEKAESKFQEKRLFFYKATGVLIRKLNVLINKYTQPKTRKLFVEYLSFILKQRLTAAVAGKPIYQTHKIIDLYRLQHPPTEDENLIKMLLKDIDEGRVPEDVITKATKKTNKALEAKKGYTVDIQPSEVKMPTTYEVTDNSGELGNYEHVGISAGYTENDNKVDKNNDDKGIQNTLENQNNEENKAECTTGIVPELNNVEKPNENMQTRSANNMESDKTNKIEPNVNNIYVVYNQNNEENKAESTSLIDPESNDVEIANDNMQNSSVNDTDSDKTKTVECNIQDINVVDNQTNEENKAESITGIGPDVNAAENADVNLENNTSNDFDSDETKKIESNIDDNCMADSDMKTEDVTTDITQTYSDDVKENEDNRGVKRKTDEGDNGSIKVSRTDDVAEIWKTENINENELEDWD